MRNKTIDIMMELTILIGVKDNYHTFVHNLIMMIPFKQITYTDIQCRDEIPFTQKVFISSNFCQICCRK